MSLYEVCEACHMLHKEKQTVKESIQFAIMTQCICQKIKKNYLVIYTLKSTKFYTLAVCNNIKTELCIYVVAGWVYPVAFCLSPKQA